METRFVKILLFLLCMVENSALAYHFSAINEDGVTIYYNIISNSEVEVTHGRQKYYGNVVIPETVLYKNTISLLVTGIGDGAFEDCTNLTSVTIPITVATIGYNAFNGCKNLKSVNIPNSITQLHTCTFNGCESLSDITLPDKLSQIGQSVFYGCKSLFSVTIPKSVSIIGMHAFRESGITSIIIPSNVKEVGNWAFANCNNLKSAVICDKTQGTKEWTFYRCKNLETLVISNECCYIGSNDFCGCSSLKNVFCYSDSVLFALENSFSDNTPIGDATLHVPIDLQDSYKTTPPWSGFGHFANLPYVLYYVDGELYMKDLVMVGTSIPPLEEPEKEGYTFSGWMNVPEVMPEEDVEITGTFSINKYTLTYMIDGEVYKTFNVEYGESIVPESDPVKEGYTFSGWSEIPQTMPAGDVIITGSFAVNTYKLTYLVDGEVYKAYEIDYGTTISPEPAPIKAGYIFSGWSEIPQTMPAKDVIVMGTFIIDTGIQSVSVDEKESYFSINGILLDGPRKGINIVRMQDGSTRKIMIK